MGVNDGKTCGNCKHAFLHQNNMECRLNPPTTDTFIVGTNPTGTPKLHKVIGYPLTTPALWCGHWQTKLEIAQSLP